MSRPGLTSVFTPPSSCSSVITWDGNLFWQGGIFQVNDPNCFPESFADVLNGYYSPGICPQGWTSAGALKGTGALVFDPAETNAMCCPSGYAMGAGSPRPGYSGIFCSSSMTGMLSNVYSTTALRVGPIPETASLTSLNAATLGTRYVWQDVIQVRWHSADTQILSLMASVSSAATLVTPSNQLSSSVPASISAITTDPPSQKSESAIPAASNPLSTGAKAGIGVGVGIAIVAFVGALLFILRRQRQK